MNVLRIVTVCACFALVQNAWRACAQTLTWNSNAPDAVWDSTSLNWLENGTPTAWTAGAHAVFPAAASGTLIEVTEELTVSSISFDVGASGITLAGVGRLWATAITVTDAATTNAVATELSALSGLTVTGPGALALGRVSGRVTLVSGTLLATASDFATAIVHVEGGTLQTLGAPDRAHNLLANDSFEEPSLDANSYKYVAAGGNGVIASWGTTLGGFIARCYPTTPTSTWISGGSVPDGNHVLIVQRHGSVTQSFHVATSGFYQLAFDHFRRRGFPPHLITPSIDGKCLPPILTVNDQFDTAHYTSVPVYLNAGTHIVGFKGCGTWYDSSTMIDLAIIAPLSTTQPCRALGVDSSVTLATGGAALLNHAGNLPLTFLDVAGNVTGPGTWSASTHAYAYDSAWSPSAPVDDVSATLAFHGDASVPSALARHLLIAEPATISGAGVTLSNLVATFDATPRLTAFAPATFSLPLAVPVVASGDPDITSEANTHPFSLFIDAAAPVTLNALTNHRYAAFVKTGPAAVTLKQPLNSAPNTDRPQAGFTVFDGELILPAFVTSSATPNETFIHALPARRAALTLTQDSQFRGGNIVLGGDGVPSLNILAPVHNTGRTLLHATLNTLQIADGVLYSTACLARNIYVSDITGKGALLKTGTGILEVRGVPPGSSIPGYLGQTIIRAGTLRILADDNPAGNGGALGQTPASVPILLGDALTGAGDAPTLELAGNASLVAHDITVTDVPPAQATLALDAVPAARYTGSVTLHGALRLRAPANASITFNTLSAPTAPQPLLLDGVASLTVNNASGVTLNLADRNLTLSPGTAAPTAFHTLTADRADFTFEFSATNDTVVANALVLSNVTVKAMYAGTDLPFSEPGTYLLFTAPSLTANPDAFTVSNPVEGFTYAFNRAGDNIMLTINADAGNPATFWTHPTSGDFATAANWSGGTVPDAAADATLGSAITNDAVVTLTAPAAVNSLRIVHPDARYTVAGSAATPLTLGSLAIDDGSHTISAHLQPSGTGPLPITQTPGASLTFSDTVLHGGLAGTPTITLAGTTALTLTGSGFSATHDGPLAGTGTLTLDASGATQTLANRSALAQTPLAVNAGTLALDASQFNAPATLASGTTLAAASPTTNGLTAFWYNGNYTNAVLSRAALEAAAAGTPAAVSILSGTDGIFTFSDLRPLAPRNDWWLLVLRGTLHIPEAGDYLFHLETDDYGYLGIDGRDIATKTPCGLSHAHAGHLTAGSHDILIGLSQMTGNAYLRIQTSRMFTSKTALPTAWLTPLSSLSTVSGASSLNIANDAHLRLTYGGAGYPQTGGVGSAIPYFSAVRPLLSGNATTVFNKQGTLDIVTLAAAAADGFAGRFVNGAGRTTLAAPDILAPSARISLYDDTTFTLTADQTAASLSGTGGLSFGAPATITIIHNDDDCDISADKTYTHAIDFGTNSGLAVGDINGVPFLSTSATSGTCTGTDGRTYGFKGMPSLGHAGNDRTAASGKLHKLLYDMNIEGRNLTCELNGLAPDKTYELRIYQRSWNGVSVNDSRNQLLGFIVNDIGRIDHQFSFSADLTNTAYYVAYRYRPSPSGALRVRLTPHMHNNTLHLYGLTNEEVPTSIASPEPTTTLTLAPPADESAHYAGAVVGNGTVTVAGPGTQIFSGPNISSGGLTITGGAAALHAGTIIDSSAFVQTPGALHTAGPVEINGLSGNGALALGLPAPGDTAPSTPYLVFLSTDASTGISTDKTYTHLYDLGGANPATINGVAFIKVTGNTDTFSASPSLYSHSGASFAGSARGPVPADSALYTLLFDMCYVGGADPAPRNTTLTLSGLTPGRPYELRIYNRSWGWNSNRQQFIDFCSTLDGCYRDSFYFNPDALAPNALVYRYVPQGTTLSIRVSNTTNNNGWHLYALTNEDLSDSDATDGGLTVAIPADRTDTFAGTLAGPAPLTKSGAGGLMLTGSSTANGPMTIAAGGFGAAFTNDAPLTTSPVTFAAGTAYLWDWNAVGAGGTLTAGRIVLPDAFTIMAAQGGQPPARWPVLVSEDAPLGTPLESITLVGFPNSVKAEYSADGRALFLTNQRGTVMTIQ